MRTATRYLLLSPLLFGLSVVAADPAPDAEETHALSSWELLTNGTFRDWDPKGPTGWQGDAGALLTKTEEMYQENVVMQMEHAPDKTALLSQARDDIAKALRPDDLLHAEIWVKCSEPNTVKFYVAFLYRIEGQLKWRAVPTMCPGDGQWNRVELDWVAQEKDLAESGRPIVVGVNLWMDAKATKPVYFAGARAWIANAGL